LDNMPGFPEGVAGIEFSQRLRQQAERFGVELLQAQDDLALHTKQKYHCVQTGDGSEYSARAILIATGSRYSRLNVPGENEFMGAGVHFCATCDGPFYKGKRVAVVGGGNSATEESLLLTKFADTVTMLVRGGEFRATKIIQESVLSHPTIEVLWHTEVKEFMGEEAKLTKVSIVNNQTGAGEELPIDGVFSLSVWSQTADFSRAVGCCWISGVLSSAVTTWSIAASDRPATKVVIPTCWKPACQAFLPREMCEIKAPNRWPVLPVKEPALPL